MKYSRILYDEQDDIYMMIRKISARESIPTKADIIRKRKRMLFFWNLMPELVITAIMLSAVVVVFQVLISG